jgi:hypothetical protein
VRAVAGEAVDETLGNEDESDAADGAGESEPDAAAADEGLMEASDADEGMIADEGLDVEEIDDLIEDAPSLSDDGSAEEKLAET